MDGRIILPHALQEPLFRRSAFNHKRVMRGDIVGIAYVATSQFGKIYEGSVGYHLMPGVAHGLRELRLSLIAEDAKRGRTP